MRTVLAIIAAYKARPPYPPTPASLSLLYLHDMATREEIRSIDLVELNLRQSDDEMLEILLAAPCDTLCFSCYVWNINRTLALCTELKRRRPETRIVLGGPEVGLIAGEILAENPYIDIVVRDEGEISFPQLLAALESGSALSEVRGLSYRGKEGTLLSTPDQDPVELEQIPSPYLDGTHDFSQNRYLNLETSRGCPRRCRFCQWGSTRVRYYPLDRVLAEIAYLQRLDRLGSLYVVDSSLLYNRQRALRILDALRGFRSDVRIYLEIDMDLVDEEIIDRLAEIECIICAFGLQSADPEVLRLAGRHLDADRFRSNIELLRRKAPRRTISIDLIYGLPGDSLDRYRSSLDFAMSLLPQGLRLHPYILLVGSWFWHRRDELGIEYDPQPPRWVFASPEFPRHDREAARRLSYYIQLLYNLPWIRESMNLLWMQLNRRRQVGHAELYERLADRLAQRLDLTGAWGCIEDGGYQDFSRAFDDGDEQLRVRLGQEVEQFLMEAAVHFASPGAHPPDSTDSRSIDREESR